MAKKEKTNAKRVAYAKKQEQQGSKVVKWIIGCLILMGLAFAIYSAALV